MAILGVRREKILVGFFCDFWLLGCFLEERGGDSGMLLSN